MVTRTPFDVSKFSGMLPAWSSYCPQEPTPKQLAGLMLPHMEVFFGGAGGGGKVVHLGGKVLTPFGFKLGRDLRQGDLINNPDGSICRIIRVHPVRRNQVWRVHFHDGTSTDVAKEHLWLAWKSNRGKKRNGERIFGESSAQVIETQELKDWCDHALEQESLGRSPDWPLIPLCKPQRFNTSRRHACEINPYLLGYLLGDGHIGEESIGITSEDVSHTQQLLKDNDLSWGITQKPGNKAKQFYIRGDGKKFLRDQLHRVKLLGKKSWDKFIPVEYLQGSLETRLAVLQGLMDTDGYCDTRGQTYYTSVSETLADGVSFIVQSLGGTSTKTSKIGSYKDDEGNKIECRRAYTLYIKLPADIKPFRLKRKLSRYRNESGNLYRRVIKVEALRETQLGNCITVSHPNGLYLTNDFIVTHNSSWLGMSALQYVDYPGYSCLLLRRQLRDWIEEDALLSRMSNWLAGTDAIWDDKTWAFIFPKSGAVIRFGHIGRRGAQMRYESSAYQMIGFDELCQHEEQWYKFMFSRLRKPVCTTHRVNSEGEPHYEPGCPECDAKKAIPLRMRSTGNPPKLGDPGRWVRSYFKINLVGDRYRGTDPTRPHIPAYLEDNPYIDQKGYSQALSRLDPVTRDQILKGNWGVSADGRFKLGWVKRFTTQGDYLLLERRKDVKPSAFDRRTCMKIMYVDPAASVKEGPGDKDVWRKDPSWTVISTFYRTPEHDLVFYDMIRVQCEVPDVINIVEQAYKDQRPEYVGLEWNTFSIGVGQELKRRGLPIKGMSPNSGDKVTRATPAMVRMEGGKVFFPANDIDFPWIREAEAEIFNWTGHPAETADIIDTLAYAGMDVVEEMKRGGVGGYDMSAPYVFKEYSEQNFYDRGGFQN